MEHNTMELREGIGSGDIPFQEEPVTINGSLTDEDAERIIMARSPRQTEERKVIRDLFTELESIFIEKGLGVHKNKWEQVASTVRKYRTNVKSELAEYGKRASALNQEVRKAKSKYASLGLHENAPKFFESDLQPLMEKQMQMEHIINIKSRESQTAMSIIGSLSTHDKMMERSIIHSAILYAMLICLRRYATMERSEFLHQMELAECERTERILSLCEKIITKAKEFASVGAEKKETVIDILTKYGITSFENTEDLVMSGREDCIEYAKKVADIIKVSYIVKVYEGESRQEESLQALASQLEMGFKSWLTLKEEEGKEVIARLKELKKRHQNKQTEIPLTAEEEAELTEIEAYWKETQTNVEAVKYSLATIEEYFTGEIIKSVEEARNSMREAMSPDHEDRKRLSYYRMYNSRITRVSDIIWKGTNIPENVQHYITLLVFCGTTLLDGWNLAILCM